MGSKRFNDAFDRLARAEEAFLQGEFLAPVSDAATVRVRIANVVCSLRIEPAEFRGWGIFQATSHEEATLVRTAGMAERREYLKLFPLVRLVLTRRDRHGNWRGLAAHTGDRRLQINGLVPIRLVDEAEQFETIAARFDGQNFWFEEVDRGSDPVTARYLRESLLQRLPLDQLNRPGLRPEQRAAYAIHFLPPPRRTRARPMDDRSPEPVVESNDAEFRLREALEHAGATLNDFMERGDGYRVTYTVGGRRMVSSVDKKNLTVQSAGICLSGQDCNFDLQSLVGVVREGKADGSLYEMDY